MGGPVIRQKDCNIRLFTYHKWSTRNIFSHLQQLWAPVRIKLFVSIFGSFVYVVTVIIWKFTSFYQSTLNIHFICQRMKQVANIISYYPINASLFIRLCTKLIASGNHIMGIVLHTSEYRKLQTYLCNLWGSLQCQYLMVDSAAISNIICAMFW